MILAWGTLGGAREMSLDGPPDTDGGTNAKVTLPLYTGPTDLKKSKYPPSQYYALLSTGPTSKQCRPIISLYDKI